METYRITNQKQLRREFWAMFPELSGKKYNGDYCTDTRCTFVDWIDSLSKDGVISQSLASRATL
jgi:hypothetical protein